MTSAERIGKVTTATNDYEIWFTSFASKGDSGGPVFMEYTLKGETFRLAVAITTHDAGTVRYGTRITLPLLRFFYNNPNIG